MFDLLLDKVGEVCEVRREDVVNGCKMQSVVDARVLLVQYLRRIGLSNDDIASIVLRKMNPDPDYYPTPEETKRKAKGVDKMFASYSERCLQSYAFCLMSRDIKAFCREAYQEFYLFGMKMLPNQEM